MPDGTNLSDHDQNIQIVWTGVAEALTVEHERLKRLADHPQVAHLESELGVLLNVMKKLRTVFPILSSFFTIANY